MKKLVIMLGAVIILLSSGLIVTYHSYKEFKTKYEDKDILTLFDQGDLNRVRHMINRHNDKKGDNITLVERTLEGGPIFHNLGSDRRTISWTQDSSMDFNTSDPKIITYTCRNIEELEGEDRIDIVLSDCGGLDKEFKLKIFSFKKEDL